MLSSRVFLVAANEHFLVPQLGVEITCIPSCGAVLGGGGGVARNKVSWSTVIWIQYTGDVAICLQQVTGAGLVVSY